jgi:hypothetical protein
MKETDKQYYTRRGHEERSRSRDSGASIRSQQLHSELADLCHEQANGSANVNRIKGIRGERAGSHRP